MLRAKPPEAVTKRLKMFMFGPSGVGKSTACCQFPKSYIVDAERGTENYDKLIREAGSVVFQTTDMEEVVQEVRSLLSVKHDYRTLVIDPITTLYNDLVDKCEKKVGQAHGRHFGEANKTMKRLANLLVALDMNIIVSAHAKVEYGENQQKLGYTFDGWRHLDYFFDLVVELGKKGKKRFARVTKTRIESFPDEEAFEWSYDAVKKRYDVATLEKEANAVTLATVEQLDEMQALLATVRVPQAVLDAWFDKARVDRWDDMPSETIGKCITYLHARMPGKHANGNGTGSNGTPNNRMAGANA